MPIITLAVVLLIVLIVSYICDSCSFAYDAYGGRKAEVQYYCNGCLCMPFLLFSCSRLQTKLLLERYLNDAVGTDTPSGLLSLIMTDGCFFPCATCAQVTSCGRVFFVLQYCSLHRRTKGSRRFYYQSIITMLPYCTVLCCLIQYSSALYL